VDIACPSWCQSFFCEICSNSSAFGCLTIFKILFLFCIYCLLSIICLGVFYLWSCLVGGLKAPFFWMPLYVARLGTFPFLILLNILFLPLDFASSPSYIPKISQLGLWLCPTVCAYSVVIFLEFFSFALISLLNLHLLALNFQYIYFCLEVL
jgi:hypothetical protein